MRFQHQYALFWREELLRLVQRLQIREDDHRLVLAEDILEGEDSKAEDGLKLVTELKGLRRAIANEATIAQSIQLASDALKGIRDDSGAQWRRRGLGVTLNGQRIQGWNDCSTFADAIQAIGCERVASLQLSINYLPLVGRDVRRLSHQHYRMQMRKRGDWVIVTHSSTSRKCELLHRIRNRLGLRLTAEIVKP